MLDGQLWDGIVCLVCARHNNETDQVGHRVAGGGSEDSY